VENWKTAFRFMICRTLDRDLSWPFAYRNLLPSRQSPLRFDWAFYSEHWSGIGPMANADSKELTMLAKHARSLNITYTHGTAFCS
jgi:hypothetical protein